MTRHSVDLDVIVENIVINLRPLKVSEKEAGTLTRSYIKALDQTIRIASDVAPGAALRAHRSFLKSLKSAIEDYERLPTSTKIDLMHFAPPYRLWPPQQDDPARTGDAVLAYLTQLAAVIASPVFIAENGAAVQHRLTRTKAARRAAAGWAHKLISEASKNPPAGTEHGAYRTIAALMYQAVSGAKIGMKHWCQEELRRQRVKEAILDSIRRQEALYREDLRRQRAKEAKDLRRQRAAILRDLRV